MRASLNYPMLKLLLCLAFVVTACSTTGLPQAETFEERYAYAISTHTAVLNSAARSVGFGYLTADEAEDVLTIADSARSFLDAARAVHRAGDTDAAERNLILATELLVQLQAYLRRQ